MANRSKPNAGKPNPPEPLALAVETAQICCEQWRTSLEAGGGTPDLRMRALASLELLNETLAASGAAPSGPQWDSLREELRVIAGHDDAFVASLQSLAAILDPEPEPVAAPVPEPVAQAPEGDSLADDPELLADFIQEASEHLASVEALTLVLERDPGDNESLNALFRSFHSIKGLAGFLELHAIREMAHQVETLLDFARNGQTRVGGEAIDAILASTDYFQTCLAVLSRRMEGKREALPDLDRPLHAKVAALCVPDALQPVAESQAPGLPPAGTEDLFAGLVEKSPSAPAPAETHPAADTRKDAAPAASGQAGAKAGGFVKVETGKLDYLVDMVGEFVIAQSMIRHDPDLNVEQNPRLQRNLAQMARITAEVQRTAMSMRMVPIQGLFQRMARLVRDLARKTGKDVALETSGEDTELDRNLIDQLADPLMHMVRNSLDHGVEGPEERVAAGKPPQGKVFLRASHEAGSISIEIADDGRGMNREKILKRAIERGLVSPGANMADADVWQLIFEPGFSTAESVTDISGRGVGMDVVRRNVQALRGRIEVQSEAGKGSCVTLRLPLTLAIIDGLLVRVGEESFVLPMYSVREMFRPEKGVISSMQNREEVADVRGRLLPMRRLYRLLGIPPKVKDPEEALLVVVEGQNGSFCLMLDDFMGKQEVVIKPLGAAFAGVSVVSAGAILGDGKVALILDVDGLREARHVV